MNIHSLDDYKGICLILPICISEVWLSLYLCISMISPASSTNKALAGNLTTLTYINDS